MTAPPPMPPTVRAAFDAFPPPARNGCLALRALIFETAAQIPDIGRIAEELRWGEPAYLTPETKSGSTIRLGVPKSGGYALFVHCRTALIADFRAIAPPDWHFDGTRAVLFDPAQPPQPEPLALLIRAALTYHCKAPS